METGMLKRLRSSPPSFAREAAIVRALSKIYATIEFEPDGTIVSANENFLSVLGYGLDEVVGKHHRMFVPKADRNSPEYAAFWGRIAKGEVFSDTFQRIRKDGSSVWIEASYTPIYNESGALIGAFKLAKDLSDEKRGHGALMNGLNALAEGKLDVRVTENLTGDFDAMKSTFNSTVQRLSEIVSDIAASETRLDGVAEKLTQNATNLDERAGRLSNAITSASQTVASLSESVRSIAEEASQSNIVIEEVSERSSNGAQVVASSVKAMQRIEEMTNEISSITKVIEGFAFQTNLLSINAAVEAARAGDKGKGFAIVASEVRTLAERSAEASQEIAGLIERAQGEVSKGAQLVNEAGEALTMIDGSIDKAVQRIGKISRDTEQQSGEMGALGQVLEQMESETQDVNTMAGSNGRRATDLKGEIEALEASLRFFRGSQGQETGNWADKRMKQQTGQ